MSIVDLFAIVSVSFSVVAMALWIIWEV